MKMISLAMLSLVGLCSVNALADASCTALMNDLLAHAQVAPTGCNRTFNTVTVRMATNRSDMKYVSYAAGVLYKKSHVVPGPISVFVSKLSGDATQQFSDREFDIAPPFPGGIPVPVMQNFSMKAQDNLGLTFGADGSFTYVLKSWGNGSGTVGGACMNNVLYGMKDGTFYTFSFEKSQLGYTGPC